jgi:hypothetical protein
MLSLKSHASKASLACMIFTYLNEFYCNMRTTDHFLVNAYKILDYLLSDCRAHNVYEK